MIDDQAKMLFGAPGVAVFVIALTAPVIRYLFGAEVCQPYSACLPLVAGIATMTGWLCFALGTTVRRD